MPATTPIYALPYLVGSDGGKQIQDVSEALALKLDATLAQSGNPPLDSDLVSLLQRLAAVEETLAGMPTSGLIQGTAGTTYKFVGASLRRVDATTWAVINDAGHKPTNVKSVSITPQRIRVEYSFTATRVVSCAVTPDDAFSAPGLRVGASVGLTYTDIYSYLGASSTPVDPGALSTAGGNLWFYGIFEV